MAAEAPSPTRRRALLCKPYRRPIRMLTGACSIASKSKPSSQVDAIEPCTPTASLASGRDLKHCAARALIDLGLAQRDDMLRTFMGTSPASRGSIAWLADTTAADPAKGSPHIESWSPFEREAEELQEAA
jgi:hypothetical protein